MTVEEFYEEWNSVCVSYANLWYYFDELKQIKGTTNLKSLLVSHSCAEVLRRLYPEIYSLEVELVSLPDWIVDKVIFLQDKYVFIGTSADIISLKQRIIEDVECVEDDR